MRTIGKADVGPIFSNATYSIFILFVLVSILILVYALSETNAEIRRFKNMYSSFRDRYMDLITREDLNRIFSNNKDFDRDLKYIRKSRKSCFFMGYVFVGYIRDYHFCQNKILLIHALFRFSVFQVDTLIMLIPGYGATLCCWMIPDFYFV